VSDEPRWRPTAPRFALLDGASPLQPLARFSAAIGHQIEVWIKREDLLPLAFGGNKLRNLEFLVGAALADGADTIVTSGRRWSNHCRLTAAAGAKAGLGVHVVLTGPPAPKPGPNERLDALFGATVHVTETAERAERAALVEEIAAELRANGHRPFVIDVGGSDTTGTLGQVLAAIELADQATARGLTPDRVILPTATGGTQAGLVVGLGHAGLTTAVTGIAVAHPSAEIRPTIDRLVGALRLEVPLPADWRPRIDIEDDYLGDGYGRPDPRADAAASLLGRTEGILVDPIYTAKALARLVSDPASLAGQRVVFWHAGGTPALFEPLEG
jgi:1-aminocyclopropane-1-carboxylate deaminase/D-cysteine desulfhydrase-like pyridoxal-dependent ACC family enzyme